MHAQNTELNITHAISTFDTDPFEPQPDAISSIFPIYVKNVSSRIGYIELPYTLPQDHTVFEILKERTIDIWKKKLDWIAEKGGMALFNSHPDYMKYDEGSKTMLEEYPIKFFTEFLEYIKSRYNDKYWNAFPKNVANFSNHTIKNVRNEMK